MENKGLAGGLLAQFAEAGTDACAFALYDGQEITKISYRELLCDVLRCAGYFQYRQIQKQHIALAAPNSYQWLVAFMGIVASGNVAVLLNPDLPHEVRLQQCIHGDVTLVCAEDSLIPESPETQGVAWVSFAQLNGAEAMQMEDICSPAPKDTIIMMFTSGTTGKSKAVEFSAENVQSYLEDVKEIMVLPDKMLLVAPMHHILGLISILFRLGNRQCVCIGRGKRYILADIPVLNPTFVPMVPAVLDSLVKLLKNAKTKEQQQRCIGNCLERISVGGAGVKAESCQFMMQLGIQVMTAYGMTETTGAGTCCFLSEDNIGTIGKTYGRMQIRIEQGELLMKSPAVMKGYYKDPEATAQVIKEGWLHTGDMGYCDEDGYYYITGRKKNVMILPNGENVNPEEVEARLGECEAIRECMVYSDGKGICADVYATDRETAAGYIKEYNDDVPRYRQIYKVNYTQAPLEKTASGKIRRKANA